MTWHRIALLLLLLSSCGGTSGGSPNPEPSTSAGIATATATSPPDELDLNSLPAPTRTPTPVVAALPSDANRVEVVLDSRRDLPRVPVAWHSRSDDRIHVVAGGARAIITASGVEWATTLFATSDVDVARCAEDRWLFLVNGVTVVVTDGFLGESLATRELPRELERFAGTVPDGVAATSASWRAPLVLDCGGEPVRDIAASEHEWVQALALAGEQGLAIVDATELRRTDSAGRTWTEVSAEVPFVDLRARDGAIEARRDDGWFAVGVDGGFGSAADERAGDRRVIGEALARDLRVRSLWIWETQLRHTRNRTRALPNGDRVYVMTDPLRVFLYKGADVRELELPQRERRRGSDVKLFDWGAATGILEDGRALHRIAPDGTITELAGDLRPRRDSIGWADSVWIERGPCRNERGSDALCWHRSDGSERTLRLDGASITAVYADDDAVLVRAVRGEEEPEVLRWLSTEGPGPELELGFGGHRLNRAADGTVWTTTMAREPELWVRWPGGEAAGEVISLPTGTRVVGVGSRQLLVAAGTSGVHVRTAGSRWDRVTEEAFDEVGTFVLSCTEIGCFLPDGRWVGRVPERRSTRMPGIERGRPPHEQARTRVLSCEREREPRDRRPELRDMFPAVSGLTRAWAEADGSGTRLAWQIDEGGAVHRSERIEGLDPSDVQELRVYGGDEERALLSYCPELPGCDSRQKRLIRDGAAPITVDIAPGMAIRDVLTARDGSWFVLSGRRDGMRAWARVSPGGSVTEQHVVPAFRWAGLGLGRHRERVALTVGRSDRMGVLVRELEGVDRQVAYYDTEALQRCGGSRSNDFFRDVSGRITLPHARQRHWVYDLLSVDDGEACIRGGDGYYNFQREGAPPFVLSADGRVALKWATARDIGEYRCRLR